MNEVIKKISAYGIVPVIKIDRAEDAVPLAKALIDGGLPVGEVTFRTAAAEEAIKQMTSAFPDMLIGAGTVLTIEQVDKAVAAGAKFIVSPGLNPKVVKYCIDHDIPVTPGVTSPSEIETAIELGLDVVKFFPAEQSGGLAKIKAMSAPYTSMKFMPTGGVNAQNINEYLAYDKVIACGGSYMVKDDLIKSGDFEKITELTKQAVSSMLGFELAHVGICMYGAEEAEKAATTISGLFDMPVKMGRNSVFAGTAFELMKKPRYGEKGHAAVKTRNICRAVAYLEARGVKFIEESKDYTAEGKLNAIYLEGEIGGFAFHLIQAK